MFIVHATRGANDGHPSGGKLDDTEPVADCGNCLVLRCVCRIVLREPCADPHQVTLGFLAGLGARSEERVVGIQLLAQRSREDVLLAGGIDGDRRACKQGDERAGSEPSVALGAVDMQLLLLGAEHQRLSRMPAAQQARGRSS